MNIIKLQLWLLKHPLKIIFICAIISSASIGGSIGFMQFCAERSAELDQMASEANDALKDAIETKIRFTEKLNEMELIQNEFAKRRNEIDEQMEIIAQRRNEMDKQMETVDVVNEFIFKKFSDGKNNNELVCPACNREI